MKQQGEIAQRVADFHAQAKQHQEGCPWRTHFLEHIDETTGDEYDCLYLPCLCHLGRVATMRDVVSKNIGPEHTNGDPARDGMVYVLEGTPEVLKLRVIRVGNEDPGSFGRHLEAGKTYSLQIVAGGLKDLDEEADTGLVDYVVPREEKRPESRGGADVVIQIDTNYIMADLDA